MARIAWHPWEKRIFEHAKKENKPILLAISASWCHWCHRMDRDTYEDDEIIEMINEKFVAIRVDADRDPEINERYNQGGWPSTAFLTHEGNVMAGGTYVPPRDMKKKLTEVDGRVAELAGHGLARHPDEGAPGPVDELAAENVIDELIGYYDADNGGFGGAPKFPM